MINQGAASRGPFFVGIDLERDTCENEVTTRYGFNENECERCA